MQIEIGPNLLDFMTEIGGFVITLVCLFGLYKIVTHRD